MENCLKPRKSRKKTIDQLKELKVNFKILNFSSNFYQNKRIPIENIIKYWNNSQ